MDRFFLDRSLMVRCLMDRFFLDRSLMDRFFLDIFFLDRNFLTEFSLTKMDSEQVIFDTNVYDTDFLTQNVLTVMWYSPYHFTTSFIHIFSSFLVRDEVSLERRN